MRKKADFLNSEYSKGYKQLVGKFMVIAFSAPFETRDTLVGLVSSIMTMVTQFKKEEVKTFS